MPVPTSPTPVARDVRLAELALAIGALALGTGEFASMGLLPYVAGSLHAPIPAMGRMISAYALGVVGGRAGDHGAGGAGRRGEACSSP